MIEERLLMALVVQAIELKGTPYLIDACQAILAAHERAPLARLERRWERHARLIELLRQTDPLLVRVMAAA